jgi:hypothetical protein
MYVYQHSNHNCIIGAAETHPIVREGKTVTHINFQPGKIDHLKLQIKGKGKKVRVCSLGSGSGPSPLLHDSLTPHGDVVMLMVAWCAGSTGRALDAAECGAVRSDVL